MGVRGESPSGGGLAGSGLACSLLGQVGGRPGLEYKIYILARFHLLNIHSQQAVGLFFLNITTLSCGSQDPKGYLLFNQDALLSKVPLWIQGP